MSRIGKKPIEIPRNVNVFVNDKNQICVEGPKGKLTRDLIPSVTIDQKGSLLYVNQMDYQMRQFHGLSRALISNMLKGVSCGFVKELIFTGVGYKVELKGQEIIMNIGFSHPVTFLLPKDIAATVDIGKTIVRLESINKESLGKVAAEIRSHRITEPYRGKGIRYSDEIIQRKEGKSKSTGK
ncbi:MAG: 50S ribosomal protein L6 [Deltaproteobacteria bacterium]|nr:MAG: 50S ribosomal protein L6 [Deltaproteobacteria bacterium]